MAPLKSVKGKKQYFISKKFVHITLAQRLYVEKHKAERHSVKQFLNFNPKQNTKNTKVNYDQCHSDKCRGAKTQQLIPERGTAIWRVMQHC